MNFDEHNKRIIDLREYFISEIERRIPDTKLNGHRIRRLPGNINISFGDILGEELLYELDAKGICASAASACSTGSKEPSHVLLAIGLSEKMAKGSLRVTIGDENRERRCRLFDKLISRNCKENKESKSR